MIACVIAGSIGNPSGFLALAMKPDLPRKPNRVFGAIFTASFTLTTVGHVGASLRFIAHALAM